MLVVAPRPPRTMGVAPPYREGWNNHDGDGGDDDDDDSSGNGERGELLYCAYLGQIPSGKVYAISQDKPKSVGRDSLEGASFVVFSNDRPRCVSTRGGLLVGEVNWATGKRTYALISCTNGIHYLSPHSFDVMPSVCEISLDSMQDLLIPRTTQSSRIVATLETFFKSTESQPIQDGDLRKEHRSKIILQI